MISFSHCDWSTAAAWVWRGMRDLMTYSHTHAHTHTHTHVGHGSHAKGRLRMCVDSSAAPLGMSVCLHLSSIVNTGLGRLASAVRYNVYFISPNISINQLHSSSVKSFWNPLNLSPLIGQRCLP